MANTSYTSADRIYANDLKIFIGKRGEIAQLERQNKIIDKKWYLAWDTGEIFIANSLKKLVRYGGTANNLSKQDIENIVQNYTKQDLEIIRAQLVRTLENYRFINNEIKDLNDKIDDTVQKLENQTMDYILQQIDKVMSNMENFAYSKGEVDDIIAKKSNEIEKNISSNYVNNEDIKKYATVSELDSRLDNKLNYATGYQINIYNSLKQNGYYLCVEDSVDKLFERGHTYFLNNGKYDDITVFAAGGGGGPILPEILLTVNGKTNELVEINSNFVGPKIFNYSIKNPKNIQTNLKFHENIETVDDILIVPLKNTALQTGSFTYSATLRNLEEGSYDYVLSGNDINGNYVEGKFTVDAIAPIFYGCNNQPKTSITEILNSNKKLSKSIAGDYTFRNNSGDYLWICAPEPMEVRKAKLNGFDVPFNKLPQITIRFGNSEHIYNFYSTVKSITQGEWEISIE